MRRAFVLGAACGVLIALSLPPFGWWPLGWLGFAGIAYLLPARRWSARLALGLGAGLGQYVIGLWWVQEFSIPGCVALMILSALFMAAAVLITPSGTPASVATGLPAAVLLSDWARARFPLGGFPLGGASLGQTLSPLVPTVKLGGSLLLTGETVLVGVAIASAARVAVARVEAARSETERRETARRESERRETARSETASGADPRPDQPTRPSRTVRSVALPAAVVAIAVCVPLAALASPSGAGGHLRPLRVALVQGGGQRGTRAIHTDPEIVFARHMDAAASIRPPVDLVVFPEGVQETSVDFASTSDSAQLAGLATGLDATVVAGVEQDVGVRRYLNEIAAWSPDGSVAGTYVKHHLVPFGEYVPWRSFLQHFFNLGDVPYDAIPGHAAGILRTPAGPLAVMISYEVFFDDLARAGVRAGGQVLVVPTNTASYRSSQVPTQELAADRMRAWETGRWLVQVTPTGYSGIVTPTGRVVARTTLGKRTVIQGTVPREQGRTVYDVLGDTPIALGALATLVLATALGGSLTPLHRGLRRSFGRPR